MTDDKKPNTWSIRLDGFDVHDASGECILTDDEKMWPVARPQPRIDGFDLIDASNDNVLLDEEKAWPVLSPPARAPESLTFCIDVPVELADTDLEKLVTEFVAKMDAMNRASGGSGLRIEKMTVTLQDSKLEPSSKKTIRASVAR